MKTVRIKDLRLDCMLGVYAQEKQAKQPVIINLTFDMDDGKAAQTDNIDDTLNYHHVVEEITAMVQAADTNLLEKLTEDVLAIVMQHERVLRATVEIDKPQAPIDHIDSVSVTAYAER